MANADGGTESRCGFVAVLGAPNVGKSTLVNRLVGSKVSIVSPKVQTTRSRVLGIVLHEHAQLVLIDTPGIFVPRRRLDRAMVAAAWSGAGDADIILLLVDSSRGLDRDTTEIVARLKDKQQRAILVLNKIDLVRKPILLDLTQKLMTAGIFTDTLMISAETGDGVGDLLACLVARLPSDPWLFPEDQISDMPMWLLAAEITREKLYMQLRQELPYATAVETERWTEQKDGSARIDQVIYVLRRNQKGIVLGRGGQQIKAIGAAAREELEALLERRVHLFLYVKVRDWSDDPERYRDFGLDFNV